MSLEKCSTGFLIRLLNSNLIGVDRGEIIRILAGRKV